ncbi:hypothetical protein AHF37_01067 [Paragonimus kellicotti]|nr:hypothetical protein AHF37_01067 [Paragonimus kellicotti]
MECSSSEILTLIEKLSTQSGQISEYECLVALLSNVGDGDLKVIARSCDIMQLFSSMDLNDGRFMETALKLANTLFSAVPVVELVNLHQAELLQALHSERTVLMEFVLTKLKDSVHQVKSDLCCIPEAILREVICLVAHEDLKVSTAAASFLFVISTRFIDGVERLFNPSSVLLINSTCVTSEQMLRIVEMATDVAVHIPSKFKKIEASGILKPVLKGLADEDSLTNLNFIQIAKDIVLIPDGYEWLADSGALNKLLVRLKEANEVAFGHLLLPGYLMFFGCLARQNPDYWLSDCEPNTRNDFLSSLIDASTNLDPAITLAALESIGHIAGRHEGRKVLHKLLTYSGTLHPILIKLGQFVKNSSSTICVRALDSLAKLTQQVTHPVNVADATEQTKIALEWAGYVGQMGESTELSTLSSQLQSAGKLLKRLTILATNPYSDIRLAALKAVCALSTQPWGARLLLDQPGCMEYLLNRNTEVGLQETPHLMQTKYEIVCNILSTSESSKRYELTEFLVLLRPEQVACLRLYVKEGVWGVQQAQSTVAMEPG